MKESYPLFSFELPAAWRRPGRDSDDTTKTKGANVMAAQTQSTLEKIARAEAASKTGLLVDYAGAKPSNEPKLPTSWGPAMRK
jgi:hypothetical protein